MVGHGNSNWYLETLPHLVLFWVVDCDRLSWSGTKDKKRWRLEEKGESMRDPLKEIWHKSYNSHFGIKRMHQSHLTNWGETYSIPSPLVHCHLCSYFQDEIFKEFTSRVTLLLVWSYNINQGCIYGIFRKYCKVFMNVIFK